MPIKDSIEFIGPRLREFELYPWLAQTIDEALRQYCLELSDSRDKYRDTLSASQDRIFEMIKELGFDYINDVLQTTSGEQENFLLSLASVLSLFKGHRDGLILVMKLLGFEISVIEWWEKTPQGEPHTFDMEITISAENVDNVLATVTNIRRFVTQYVYPKFETATLVFSFDFAEANTAHSLFVDIEQDICVEATL